MNSQTLIFVHLPKTGGTTITDILLKVYDATFYLGPGANFENSLSTFFSLEIEKRLELQLVYGHHSYFLKNHFINPILLTFLREPLDLFCSLYHYIRRTPNHPHFTALKAMKSIQEFIPYSSMTGLNNIQTRFLLNSELHLTNSEYRIQDFSDTELNKKYLAKAKDNLSEFNYVFFQHQIFQALNILKDKLNWNFIPEFRNLNVTENRPKIDSLEIEIKNRIKEINKLDIDLYNFAKSKEENNSANV